MNSLFGNPAALQGCESPSMTKRTCIINERLMTGWDVDMSARWWSSLKAVRKECTPLSEQFYERSGTIQKNCILIFILLRFIIIILVIICILTSNFGQGVLHEHNSMTIFLVWHGSPLLAWPNNMKQWCITRPQRENTWHLTFFLLWFSSVWGNASHQREKSVTGS